MPQLKGLDFILPEIDSTIDIIPQILFNDTHREEAPSHKTPTLTKNTNMGIWVVGISNQFFITGS